MEQQTDKLSLLTLQIAGQTYGVPVTRVVQIVEMVTITYLPQLPPAVRGVINYRGQVLPVMDLRERFGLPAQAYGLHTPIVLVEVNGRNLGLVADLVVAVLEADTADMNQSRDILPAAFWSIHTPAAPAPYITHVVKVGREIVPLLQVDNLLTVYEVTQLDQAITTVNAVGVQPS